MTPRAMRAKAALLAFAAILAVAASLAPASAQWGAAVPRQHQAPPPPPAPKPAAPAPETRPYDTQMFRLAEILGALHYLRELCGANEGQVWRDHMRELVSAEGTSPLRRAKLVESFNRGYRDYSRTYRTCTQPALVAIQRFMEQASAITDTLAANDK